MRSSESLPAAILLLGPTGAGKTPLGEWLHGRPIGGRRCVHFDFGEQLRIVGAQPSPPVGLTVADLAVIRRCLATHALLEDHQFPIAAAILRQFMAERSPDGDNLLILNGLPRHSGQAAAVDRLVDITSVVVLACSADVVRARIARNTGGDRTHRVDDDAEAITKKLAAYEQRTRPLAELYRRRGTRMLELPIGLNTDADAVGRRLTAAWASGWTAGL